MKKGFTLRFSWFMVGLFLMYLILLLGWVAGREPTPKWAVLTLPLWFGILANIFDFFYDIEKEESSKTKTKKKNMNLGWCFVGMVIGLSLAVASGIESFIGLFAVTGFYLGFILTGKGEN